MRTLPIILLLFGSLLRACCSEDQRLEPSYPSSVLGWGNRDERGLRIRGDFVLKRNEATENEKLQIKLLELIPGDPCAEVSSVRHYPRARLRFVRLSDEKVLCEDDFFERGSTTLATGKCGNALTEYGILGIYMVSINLKEGWVLFELRG